MRSMANPVPQRLYIAEKARDAIRQIDDDYKNAVRTHVNKIPLTTDADTRKKRFAMIVLHFEEECSARHNLVEQLRVRVAQRTAAPDYRKTLELCEGFENFVYIHFEYTVANIIGRPWVIPEQTDQC